MNYSEAKQIVKDAISGFDAAHVIRIIGERADSVMIKEKKTDTISDATKQSNVIAACKLKGLEYKGIGVGFDYNAQEYTMILSYSHLNKV